jgi:serine/threonine protein kinase
MTKGADGKRGSLTGRAKIQGPSGTVAYEWYIVMEFCEQGTLWGHITRGKTHRQRQVSAQGAYESGILEPNPNIDPNQLLLILEWDAWASLQFLKEIASALRFLHDHDIVHADVKSDNVLLSSSSIDRRGVTAKLTDFGLSRILKSGSKVKTKTFGTVTHQPPELLKSNILSPAADIYAFGIFAWELFTMREAHGDLSESEVILGVGAGSLRPSFPSDCPSAYVELVSKCWANCPDDRLTAAELEDELDRVQASFCPRGQDSPWMLLSAFT